MVRWPRFRCLLLVLLVPAFGMAESNPLWAQGRRAKLRPGDRVEAETLGEWQAGTVVEGSHMGGWVTVRLDDDGEFSDAMPAAAREQFLTRPFPPDRVRTAKAARGANRSNKAAQTRLRTWSDRTGKFKVEARFDRVNGDKVALIKADGKRVEVPLARLSEADAAYVRTVGTDDQSPFQEVADDPDATEPAATNAPASKASWGNAKTIRPQTFAKWSFVPPTSDKRSSAAASASTDSIALADIPGSETFFEDVHGVHVSQDGRRAIIAREEGQVGNDKQQYLEVIDVAAGQSRGLIALPPAVAVLDVDADTGLVMYRTDVFGHGKNTLLTVARVDDDKLSPVISWEPYSQEDWEPRRDIQEAWFLGPDRAMTINNHGNALTVWEIGSAKALLNLPVGRAFRLRIAQSTDGRLLAVIMEKGIALIDLSAGRHVATIPLDGRGLEKVEFSEDNRYLAGVSDVGMALWDLTTGKQVADFYHSALGRHSGLAWAGDFVLINNQFLFDPERRVLLWEYQNAPGGDLISDLRGGRLWAVSRPDRSGPMTFIASPLPHAAALEVAASLPSADELLVVRPGDTVSIDIDVDPNIADPNGIRASLAEALEAAGLKVADGSKLVLKAICKQQPSQTIRISLDPHWPARRDGKIEERTITPHASYLDLSLDGEPLWKRGYVARPGMMIHMMEGENLDQALERLTKPNLAIFENAKFSAYVARPGKATDNGAYGVSQVTPQGIVDDGTGGERGVFQ